MSREYESHEVPKRPTDDPREDRTHSRTEDDRKENSARYKENVDQLNRTRDREIERALSGVRDPS